MGARWLGGDSHGRVHAFIVMEEDDNEKECLRSNRYVEVVRVEKAGPEERRSGPPGIGEMGLLLCCCGSAAPVEKEVKAKQRETAWLEFCKPFLFPFQTTL
jgi:hypothetical protein